MLRSLVGSEMCIRDSAMGRGRSKAKQTKVARDLKYHSQDIDIDRLAKELHGEVDKNSDEDDFDPFAEGNYIPRK